MKYKFKAIGIPMLCLIITLIIWALAAILTTTFSVGQSGNRTSSSIAEMNSYYIGPNVYQPPQILVIFGKIFNHIPLISFIIFIIFLTRGIILSRKATKYSKLMASDPASYTPYFFQEVTLIKRNARLSLMTMFVLMIITVLSTSQRPHFSGNNQPCQPIWDPTIESTNTGGGDFVLPPGCQI